ncbi:ADIPOR-like receptor SPBC12C2.09c [Cladobotryum mycophilum]|uniref:ADIPOR-like receptor SPBC12C2.09c n=1 Tax=Cladobotryum mycophilum TaxID=491253 RepID=A0ABR0S8C9_9HYPO
MSAATRLDEYAAVFGVDTFVMWIEIIGPLIRRPNPDRGVHKTNMAAKWDATEVDVQSNPPFKNTSTGSKFRFITSIRSPIPPLPVMSLRRASPEGCRPQESESLMKDGTDKYEHGDQGWFNASGLMLFNEIPSWQQDNEYILSGYRPTSGSAWISVTSLLYLNNQTINTYSHLVGAIIFLSLPLYFYEYIFKHQPNAQVDDLLVISTYSFGVAISYPVEPQPAIRQILQ